MQRLEAVVFDLEGTLLNSASGPPSQLYPMGHETLESLRAQGIKLALCTNRQEESSRRILDRLGLLRYFSAVAGGDTFTVRKPHPNHVLNLLALMDIPPARAFTG